MRNFKNNLVQRVLGIATRVLGEPVQYQHQSGAVSSIQAIFDNEWQQVDPDTERVVSSNQPVIGIKLSDLLVYPKVGDLIIVIDDIKNFIVQDVREDGQGGASLFLRLETKKAKKKKDREGLLE